MLKLLKISFIFTLWFSKLLDYLKHVHFTNDFGEDTKFDINGDPVAMYDLINWQLSGKREVQYATVGRYDETMQPKLVIEEKNIIWNENQKQVCFYANFTNCVVVCLIVFCLVFLFVLQSHYHMQSFSIQFTKIEVYFIFM